VQRSHAEGISPSVVVVSDPAGPAAEAIRTLRTHLVAQHLEAGRRALVLCGASGGVGASFVAANLAVSTSQTGLRTLLIDANLRAPGLEAFIPPTARRPGLAQFLMSGDMDWSEAIHADLRPNLSVMFSGGPSSDAPELLGADRFRALTEFCLREFDFTLFDTPPTNMFADGRRVSTVIGYSLIVARRNQTYFDDIKALGGQLRDDHATVVGAVLNEG
jgi:capsular exopolysaccharide synthesis family protein